MIIDKKKGDKMKIVDIIKSNFAVSMEKGELVYNYIVTEMSKGAVPIHLDFLGIETTITTFFNSSYGRLFEKYTQEEVDKNIIFEKIEEEYDLKSVQEYLKAKSEGTLNLIPFEEAIKEWNI